MDCGNSTQLISSEHKKRAYTKPALTTYGTVSELTETVGKHGNPDFGTGNKKNTQV